MTNSNASTIASLVNVYADALNRFFRSSGVPYAYAQDLAQATLETLLGTRHDSSRGTRRAAARA